MEKKIDSFKFILAFCERYESIEPDENSLDFGDLLSKIDNSCR